MKEWTLMMYMNGDRDLAKEDAETLAEMKTVGSTSSVDAVAQITSPGAAVIRRRHLQSGAARDLDEVTCAMTNMNFGLAPTVTRFIEWANSRYPAKRRMLVIRSHGNGLGPALRASFLPIVELKKAFAQGRSVIGRRFEIIGFETCFMNTIEAVYELRDCACFIISSQSRIPGAGWPFQPIMRDLDERPVLEAPQVAERVVEHTLQSIRADQFATISALDCTRVDTVIDAISTLANRMKERLDDPGHLRAVKLAHYTAQGFEQSETVDLLDFCRELARQDVDADIVAACGEVRAAASQFVLRSGTAGATVSRARGISIFFPKWNVIPAAYEELDFAQDCSWSEFLKTYVSRLFDTTRPEVPAHHCAA